MFIGTTVRRRVFGILFVAAAGLGRSQDNPDALLPERTSLDFRTALEPPASRGDFTPNSGDGNRIVKDGRGGLVVHRYAFRGGLLFGYDVRLEPAGVPGAYYVSVWPLSVDANDLPAKRSDVLRGLKLVPLDAYPPRQLLRTEETIKVSFATDQPGERIAEYITLYVDPPMTIKQGQELIVERTRRKWNLMKSEAGLPSRDGQSPAAKAPSQVNR